MDLSFLIQGLGPFFVTLILISLLFPVERYFPAVSKRQIKKGRLTAIILLGACTAIVVWFFNFYALNDFIRYLLSFQIINISRAAVPDWVLFVGTFLFIDFVAYLLHFASHKFSLLWRIHSVHHSDEHVTAASFLLQHPLASIITLLVNLFFGVLLGLPLLVIILYSFIAIAHGAFAHADIYLPKRLDSVLRWVIVTPDLHRTHHSIDMKEGNSNFGSVLSIWDRLLGTFIEEPKTGVSEIVMGLPKSERPKQFSFIGLLLHPFQKRG